MNISDIFQNALDTFMIWTSADNISIRSPLSRQLHEEWLDKWKEQVEISFISPLDSDVWDIYLTH